jgi:outer membrane protein
MLSFREAVMNKAAVLLLTILTAASAQTTVTLRQLLDLAAQRSPQIQLSMLNAAESRIQSEIAASAYAPQLNITTASAYQTSNLQGIGLIAPGVPSRTGAYRVFNARPQLTAPVFDLALLSSIRASRERIVESKFDAESARQTTLAAVLELALNHFQAVSRIEAAEARLRTAEAVYEQAQQAEAAGTASKLDLARTAQQVAAERAALRQASRDREVLRTLLLEAAGLDQSDALELRAPELVSFAPHDRSVERILRGSAEQRSELSAGEARIRAAALDQQSAQRERLPKLGFVGDYGLLGAGPDRAVSTYTAGASVTIPVFTGGRLRAKIAEAQVKERQAETELRKTRLAVEQQVRRAVLESDGAREMLEAYRQATNEARKALELSRMRFGAGLTTSVDVATAQSALAEAEDAEIRTRYEWYAAEARLARAEGDVYWFFDRGR